LENAKNTVEGRHGGKHYFEDEDYIKSKKETTGRDKHIIQMFDVRLERLIVVILERNNNRINSKSSTGKTDSGSC